MKTYSDTRKIAPLAAVSDSELNFPSQRMLSKKTIASFVNSSKLSLTGRDCLKCISMNSESAFCCVLFLGKKTNLLMQKERTENVLVSVHDRLLIITL